MKTGIALLALGFVAVGMIGCVKEEGPAERAGKSVDRATSDAADAIEDAGDDLEDAVEGRRK